jgi:hypothetical protein
MARRRAPLFQRFGPPKLALGHIANCAYRACMGRVVVAILALIAAAAIAVLSGIIAHDDFGIATDTIRIDALRSAACIFIVLSFGNLLRLRR